MKAPAVFRKSALFISLGFAVAVVAGCGTTPFEPAHPGDIAKYYQTTDNRNICIGKNEAQSGGRLFKEPHMDLAWIADGFDFNGYDTLYIAPVIATAKVPEQDAVLEQVTGEAYRQRLKTVIESKKIFTNVVMEEAAIKPGAKVLKLTNTIVNYSRGNETRRYWGGIFGAGQPDLNISGVATDGDKEVFIFKIRRSGTSFAAFSDPGNLRNEYLQRLDIGSMLLDLTDFIAAIAGKYKAVN